MELTLSFEQARDGLRKAVAARGPDFVYPSEWRIGAGPVPAADAGYCTNFGEDGSPRCIVGYVLWLNGVTPETDEWMSSGVDRLSGRDGDDFDTLLHIDDKTYLMLFRVQNEQDGGVPWGIAVSAAEKTAEAYERNKTGND